MRWDRFKVVAALFCIFLFSAFIGGIGTVVLEGRADATSGAEIVLSSSSGVFQFNAGYKVGYRQGWCFGEYGCIAPIVPIPPPPGLGERNYTDGYNRGFIDGRQARAEQSGRVPANGHTLCMRDVLVDPGRKM